MEKGGIFMDHSGCIPMGHPAANRWPTGDPFPMERIWVKNAHWNTPSVHHFGDETLRATNCDNNERPQSHLAYLQAIQHLTDI